MVYSAIYKLKLKYGSSASHFMLIQKHQKVANSKEEKQTKNNTPRISKSLRSVKKLDTIVSVKVPSKMSTNKFASMIALRITVI